MLRNGRRITNRSVRIDSWATAFNVAKVSVPELLEEARDIMAERHDFRVTTPKGDYTPAQGLPVDGENVRYDAKVADVTRFVGNQVALGLPGDGMALYNLEDNAFNQLARKLGTPFFGPGDRRMLPRDYMTHMGKVNPAVYEQLMNYHVGLYPNGGYIRTHGDAVTAWMGSDYQRFDADDMLDLLNSVMIDAAKGGQTLKCAPIQPQIWRDGMDIMFLTHVRDGKNNDGSNDGDDSGGYASGFTMTTGHTGNISVQILPFVMRGACTNSARYNSESQIKFKHSGNRQARLTSMYTAIMDSMNLSQGLYDNMLAARRVALPSLAECANKLKDAHDLTDKFFDDMLWGAASAQGGAETLFALSNGITWAVQQDDDMAPETRIKLETAAGNMLDEDLRPDWLRKAIAKAEQRVMVEVR